MSTNAGRKPQDEETNRGHTGILLILILVVRWFGEFGVVFAAAVPGSFAD